jgi:hypothetical protein
MTFFPKARVADPAFALRRASGEKYIFRTCVFLIWPNATFTGRV